MKPRKQERRCESAETNEVRMRVKTHTSPPSLYNAVVKIDLVNCVVQNSRKVYSKNEKANSACFAKWPRLHYILVFIPVSSKTSQVLEVHTLEGEGDAFSQKKY
jgi:hypothetical protein